MDKNDFPHTQKNGTCLSSVDFLFRLISHSGVPSFARFRFLKTTPRVSLRRRTPRIVPCDVTHRAALRTGVYLKAEKKVNTSGEERVRFVPLFHVDSG